jgi:hypothetical protein
MRDVSVSLPSPVGLFPPSFTPPRSTCAPFSSTSTLVGTQTMQNGGAGYKWGQCNLNLNAGQTIVFGTANMAGAQQTGATYLWLMARNVTSGTQIIVAMGSAYPLQWSATALANGPITVLEGCTGPAYTSPCSGTVGYQIYTATTATAYSPPLPKPSPPPPPSTVVVSTSGSGTCPPFSGATRVVTTCKVYASAGSVLALGTTIVGGARCTGDTYLTLQSPSGSNIISSDDANGGMCSYITYNVPASGYYIVQEGCFDTGSCSGTVGYQLR